MNKKLIYFGFFVIYFFVFNCFFIFSQEWISGDYDSTNFYSKDFRCDISQGSDVAFWVTFDSELNAIVSSEEVKDELGNCRKEEPIGSGNYFSCCPDPENQACLPEFNNPDNYICRPLIGSICSDFSDSEDSCKGINVNSNIAKNSNNLDESFSCGDDIEIKENCYRTVNCYCNWDPDSESDKCNPKYELSSEWGNGCTSGGGGNGFECVTFRSTTTDLCEDQGIYSISVLREWRDSSGNKIIDPFGLNDPKNDNCKNFEKSYPCSSLTQLGFFSSFNFNFNFLLMFFIYFLIIFVSKKNN